MRAALAVVVLAACGTPAQVATHRPLGKDGASAASPSPRAWQWSRVSSQEGHLRMESETYQLRMRDTGELDGWMIRENRFLSTDGEPFACMQGLSYTQRARYRLRGAMRAGAVDLEELEVKTLPSPCEAGLRPLQSYRGQARADGGLDLEWQGGEQRLAPRPPVGSEEEARLWPAAGPLTGSWVWTTRQREGSVERLEREEWRLEEVAHGRIRGRYLRRVMVVDTSGASIGCAGADRYGYRDTYQIRGLRDGKGIHLQEISVRAADHPCLASERVLDTAKARLYADALELEWRGKRVQVLRRARDVGAAPSPDSP